MNLSTPLSEGKPAGWRNDLEPCRRRARSPFAYTGFNTAAVTASGWYWPADLKRGQIFYNATSLYPSATAVMPLRAIPAIRQHITIGHAAANPMNQIIRPPMFHPATRMKSCLTTLKI
jgi:hypothetical protein